MDSIPPDPLGGHGLTDVWTDSFCGVLITTYPAIACTAWDFAACYTCAIQDAKYKGNAYESRRHEEWRQVIGYLVSMRMLHAPCSMLHVPCSMLHVPCSMAPWLHGSRLSMLSSSCRHKGWVSPCSYPFAHSFSAIPIRYSRSHCRVVAMDHPGTRG